MQRAKTSRVSLYPSSTRPHETIAIIAFLAKRYLAIWPTFNYPWQWETGIVEIIKIHRLSSNFSLITCTLLLLYQARWKCYLKMICFDSGFISFHVPCPPNRGNNKKPYFIVLSSGPNKKFGS